MKVPLADLAAQHAQIAGEVMPAVAELLGRQAFILGPPVAEFERALAAHAGAAHAIGVASGSDALVLALRALGIGAGDAVLTTAFTFVATGEAIVRAGARPIFCDVDPHTLTLSAESVRAEIARCAGKTRPRAILPVHLFGRAADMDALCAIAGEHGLAVVEDAAQAIGASASGRMVGAIGSAGCFSFFPSKNLGAWGDGGAVVTGSAETAARVRSLRAHGAGEDGGYQVTGMNSRLDALQAVVLGVKLRHLDAWTRARIAAASEIAGNSRASASTCHQPWTQLCQSKLPKKIGCSTAGVAASAALVMTWSSLFGYSWPRWPSVSMANRDAIAASSIVIESPARAGGG